MHKHFDKEGEDRVIAQYLAGSSIISLAKQEGCCIPTVRNMFRRRKVNVRGRGAATRLLASTQLEPLIADYNNGMVQTELARKYNVSQNSVSRYLRSSGVKMNLAGAALHGFQRCRGRIRLGSYMAVLVPRDSPFASMRNNGGYVLEHRLVMAQELGRPLRPSETVHHKDGDKLNNDPANLELRQGNHGTHERFRCADCGSHNVEPY